MATLTLNTPLTESFSGAAVTHTVGADGLLEVNLWGAGGGGGIALTNFSQRAGGGGYLRAFINVVAGDSIQVWVGGGGKKPTALTTQAAGGWPDGGSGARGSGGGADNYTGGGGGGSTRIYRNGVLVAVAGGGGGGSRGWGGAGGGSTGGQGYGGASGDSLIGGFGGSQTAGGLGDPNNASTNGASLQGGNSVMNSANGGGGGGGGYFGGGASRGVVSCGGGGSNYRHPTQTNAANTSLQAGDKTGVPQGTGSSAYPGGQIGYGGVSGRSAANAALNEDGYNGAAVLTLRDQAFIDSLPVQVFATGADQTFTVTKNGLYTFRMWGAGGGGGLDVQNATPPLPPGGAGAYTEIEVVGAIGDVFKLQVGRGGLRARSPNTNGGGWPDGGNGGTLSGGPLGSGGGSTRVWKNDVLIAVAGAGGGSGGLKLRGDAGAGGGNTGMAAYDRTLVADSATGGSQTAGGVNVAAPTDTSKQGAYLKGGHGYLNGASATVADTNSGAGGGGGYYGGGGGGRSGTFYQGGGGGSGYVAANVTGSMQQTPYTTAQDGSRGVPPNTGSSFYPPVSNQTPLGYGGQSSGSLAGITDGGDGVIVYTFQEVAVGEPFDAITVSAPTGSAFRAGSELQLAHSTTAYEATVGETGTLICHLWGGGGGGGYSANGATTRGAGGSGGYVLANVQVSEGDVVRVEVGAGGLGARAAPAAGGWPDGGAGVHAGNAGPVFYSGAGGGGSTRLYVNNVLQLVAGAGGGGWGPGSDAPENILAGGGGGLVGGSGRNRINVLIPGGTQTEGGANANGNGTGGALQGGNPTGTGGGGGGGWYGGAGGNSGGGSTFGAGGGGGSSWADGVRVSEPIHEQGAQNAGPAGGSTTDPRYIAGVGVGGLAGASAPAPNGGDGYALIQLVTGVPANKVASFDVVIPVTAPEGSGGVPAAASGDIGVVAINSPAGVGQVPAATSGGLATINVTAPEAALEAGVNVAGDIPTITLPGPPTGGAVSSALINTAELLLIDLVSPEADLPTGAVDFQNPAPFSPASIVVSAVEASILGYADGDLPIVLILPPEGEASTGQEIVTEPFENDVTLTDPQGNAVSIATPSGGLQTITIVTPLGSAQSDSASATGEAFPNDVTITAWPDGDASTGPDIYGEAFENDITVTAWPDGTATGAALAVAENEANGDNPNNRYLRRIMVTQPEASPEAGVTVDPLPAPAILIQAPDAIVDLGAFVLAPIQDLIVVSFTGIGQVDRETTGLGIPVIDVDTVWGYADDSKPGKLRLKRTQTPGLAPTSLQPREVVLNEADGTIYHRAADGSITKTELAKIIKTPFTIGPAGKVLNGLGAWVDPDPLYTEPVLLPRPTGTAILCDAYSRPVITAPTAGRVVYHVFTVRQTTEITALSVDVAVAGAGFADLGICHWNSTLHVPGLMINRDSVNCGTIGRKSVDLAITLQPGVYAAAFAYGGSASPQFLAYEANQKLGLNYQPIGDHGALQANGFGAPPTVNEPFSIAYISAETT